MIKKMKAQFEKLIFMMVMLFSFTVFTSNAQEIPLSYGVENRGANCTKPVLPAFEELPVIRPLTDPFEWSDRSGRDTTLEGWICRRNEIINEIQNYEVGPKPERPDTITASYENKVLTVNITENGKTLTLRSQVTLPEGEGPFAAIIGMGGGSGSLPAEIFTKRGIATIGFNFGEVMAHQQSRGNEPINKLYPDLAYMGAYAAWPWGVSRLIDGLELVQDVLPIDLSRLAVSGCSFAGKMALFAGALDERIALTIAQESGGGGAAAWRVSETLTGVETLGNTDQHWFMQAMWKFSGSNVSKLPHDHHELMALVAPRALLVLGNPDYIWLADESGYVSCRAAERVWENFGVPERFGFSIIGGHSHCAVDNNQYKAVEAFVDRFLVGDTTVSTNYELNTYPNVDYSAWTAWWGTGVPDFGKRDANGSESIWLEVECGTIGAKWDVLKDLFSSNQYCVRVKSKNTSIDVAPTNPEDIITIPFKNKTNSKFDLFGRLICSMDTKNAIWVKVDNGEFKKYTGQVGPGWAWQKMLSIDLEPGDHSVSIAYCKEGVKIDKLCVSNNSNNPLFEGEESANLCEVKVSAVNKEMSGYSLGQNFPNPVTNVTSIPFGLARSSYVSLKVYNMTGAEVAELAGKEFSSGNHVVEFNSKELSKGIYFYTLNAGNYSASQKMIIQ